MRAQTRQPATAEDCSVDYWIHRVNRLCGRFQGDALDAHFTARIESYAGEALNLSFVDARKARLYRTRAEITSSDCHYYAVFQLAGHTRLDQEGQRALLSPGDIALIDSCRPFDVQYDGLSRQMSLIVPRAQMDACLHHARVRCGQRIEGSSRLALLANQLLLGSVQNQGLDSKEGEAMVAALVTLLGPALIGRERDDPHERAFGKAMSVIEANLCAPELTPALVASEVGVSMRSLYRIFAERDMVVAQHIKLRRLELCAERLRNAASEESLCALCFDCGFSDASYFSTAFKKHFGMTPSQYRVAMRGQH